MAPTCGITGDAETRRAKVRLRADDIGSPNRDSEAMRYATAFTPKTAADSSAGLGARPRRVLVVWGGTGGGHWTAATAVAQALGRAYPGRYEPVLVEALTGPAGSSPVRAVCRLYGPTIRWTPWVWGLLFHLTDSGPGARALRAVATRAAHAQVAFAMTRYQPVAVVSVHPLTARAAVVARDSCGLKAPVVSVVTDLVHRHRVWDDPLVDRLVVPDTGVAVASEVPADRVARAGIPVAAGFTGAQPGAKGRARLRDRLGLEPAAFVVLVTGGGEGAGGMACRVRGLARLGSVQVVAVCGRNRRLARRLAPVAARSGGRVRVLGFVDNMADWLRAADLVVGKAGPGMIAEAAACATPMLLTSHVPGQERGNAAAVQAAGAGCPARSVRRLLSLVRGLRDDPDVLAALAAGSATLGRPLAATQVAALLDALTALPPDPPPSGGTISPDVTRTPEGVPV